MKSTKNGFAVSVSELAKLCRVHRSTVQAWMRDPAFPKKQPDGFDLFEVGQWKGVREEAQKQAEQQQRCKPSRLQPADDPLLAGFDSPALEEYRRMKAGLARLDLAEREKELVPLDRLQEFHGEMARCLRSGLDNLQRFHGVEALALMTEVLDEMDRKRGFFFSTDTEHGGQAA